MMKRMKFLVTVILSLSFQVASFAQENPDSLTGSTFEIYAAEHAIRYSSGIDYSKIDLDTVQLNDTPFLTSDVVESYDSLNHIINLKEPVDSLVFPFIPVYGQMFVVLINKEPQYCGFFWTIASSVPCRWIVILDSNISAELTNKQIQISTGYPDESWFTGLDPRGASEIINDINSFKLSPFEVYPNPTTGNVTITGIDKHEKLEISIYNEIGELVKMQEVDFESNQVDLNELLSGVYFVRINSYKTIKIIKH